LGMRVTQDDRSSRSAEGSLLNRAELAFMGTGSAEHEVPYRTNGKRRVLLVDDDELIQELMVTMLEILGYDPVLASDGPTALKLYGTQPGEIELVILDMQMPGMDGLEVFRRLKKIDSSVSVVICSGFAKEQKIQQACQEGALGFLAKPFSIADLEKKLTAVKNRG
jgi:two-component system cell cycle sensor histidine kinase/response regulator CckA